MKLKNGLFLSNMGDEFVVTAESPEIFRGIVKLNKSGAFVFEQMQKNLSDSEIVDAICEKYEIDCDTAKDDYNKFLEVFVTAGICEE